MAQRLFDRYSTFKDPMQQPTFEDKDDVQGKLWQINHLMTHGT